MRLPTAIQRMAAVTPAFGNVGCSTGDKITPADCAFICRGIQSNEWDAARLHWGDDRTGIWRLALAGFLFAQQVNEQGGRGLSNDQLWRLAGIALAEFGSPIRVWMSHYVVCLDADGQEVEHGEEMRSVKWTQSMRACLFGVVDRQWRRRYTGIYEDVHRYYCGLAADAARQAGR